MLQPSVCVAASVRSPWSERLLSPRRSPTELKSPRLPPLFSGLNELLTPLLRGRVLRRYADTLNRWHDRPGNWSLVYHMRETLPATMLRWPSMRCKIHLRLSAWQLSVTSAERRADARNVHRIDSDPSMCLNSTSTRRM